MDESRTDGPRRLTFGGYSALPEAGKSTASDLPDEKDELTAYRLDWYEMEYIQLSVGSRPRVLCRAPWRTRRNVG